MPLLLLVFSGCHIAREGKPRKEDLRPNQAQQRHVLMQTLATKIWDEKRFKAESSEQCSGPMQCRVSVAKAMCLIRHDQSKSTVDGGDEKNQLIASCGVANFFGTMTIFCVTLASCGKIQQTELRRTKDRFWTVSCGSPNV